ncbi:MAG: hypothetical protein JNN27_00490 [Planctomycetes bacterium]|nr:hypothetical protein [Planctomycetota bacterium]
MSNTESKARLDRPCEPSPIMEVYARVCEGERINPEWLRETRVPSGASVGEIMERARRDLPFICRHMTPPLLRRDVVMLYAETLARVHFDQFAMRHVGYRPIGHRRWVETDMLLIVLLAAPQFVEVAFGSPWWSVELLQDMKRWDGMEGAQADDPSCEFYRTDRAAMIRWQRANAFNAAWKPDYRLSATRLLRLVDEAVDGGESSGKNEPRHGHATQGPLDGRRAAAFLRLAQQQRKPFVFHAERGSLVIAGCPDSKKRRRKIGPQRATLRALGLIGKRRSKRECALKADVDPVVGSATQAIEASDELLQVRAIIERRRRAAKPNSATWHVLNHIEDIGLGTSVRSLAAKIGMDESSLRDELGREREAIGRELRRA